MRKKNHHAVVIFLQRLLDVFDVENTMSGEEAVQKLEEINEIKNYNGKSFFVFLDEFLTLCVELAALQV